MSEKYREVIEPMVRDMIYKLEKNEHKSNGKGIRGWEDCSWQYLIERAREELDELVQALIEGRKRDAQLEASDVSNFMAMIYDNITQKRI